MITLKVAFKKGILFRHKELFFDFKIGALEYATKELLKIEFWEITEYKGPEDLNVVLLYAAYYYACMSNFKKPKYKYLHAFTWYEHLSKTDRDKMALALIELFGDMGKTEKPGKSEKKK